MRDTQCHSHAESTSCTETRRGRVPARGAFTLENMEDAQPPGSRMITTDFCVEKSSRFARTPRMDGQLVKNGEKNSSIF